MYYKIIAKPKICKPHTKIYQEETHGDFLPHTKGKTTNFHENLVGGFNPLETYYIVSQIGSFPDIGAKIKNIGNIWKKPPPRNIINV